MNRYLDRSEAKWRDLHQASRLSLLVLLLLFLTPAIPLRAQGCTQCLDSTRATPPQVQAAYRHAIFLLGGTAVAIFLGGTLLLRSRR